MTVHNLVDAEMVQRGLGDQIRRRRGQYGWSQEHFAGMCGLHRTYMGHVERGKKNVSLSTVVRIANALGIRLAELFKGAEIGLGKLRKPERRNAARMTNGGTWFGAQGVEMNALLGELRVERKALRSAVKALGDMLGARGKR